VNLSDLPITIISQRARTAVVQPYGFPMECEYEHDEGEAPIFWPTEAAHPGCPPNAELLSCKVGGVDIYPMLSSSQIEWIEEKILDQLEG
jgi:hypothetical protein